MRHIDDNNPVYETFALSHYLRGMSGLYESSGMPDQAERLQKAAKYMRQLSREICGGGYICSGGPNCTSDHK